MKPPLLLALIPVIALTSCQTGPIERDIGSHDRPVTRTPSEIQADTDLASELSSEAVENLKHAPGVSPNDTYTLAELIDIAQLRNPVTRKTWLTARVAAREAGVAQSALLPLVTASAIAGAQRFDTTIDPALLPPSDISTEVSGAAAVLSASWLLFDFGENVSRRQAADQLARMAELAFNRTHQQLIFDVVTHYHSLQAARTKIDASESATHRAQQLVDAAEKRRTGGVGTEVEVAQARHLLAQTRMVERQVAGQANTAAVSLAVALNLPPGTRIQIQPESRPLPSGDTETLDRNLEVAFANRPEVLASLAQVRAAQYDLDATNASYLPKLYAGGNLLVGTGGLSVNGFEPGGIGNTSGNGVFVGVTVPLYDGNLKRIRKQNANDRLDAAKLEVSLARAAASREVGLTYEALRTALAVFDASEEMVAAAGKTAEAAEAAYTSGLGTVSDASFATLGEFTAIEVRADAKAAVYRAAAALALATGTDSREKQN